jgi:hypothetical protein
MQDSACTISDTSSSIGAVVSSSDVQSQCSDAAEENTNSRKRIPKGKSLRGKSKVIKNTQGGNSHG